MSDDEDLAEMRKMRESSKYSSALDEFGGPRPKRQKLAEDDENNDHEPYQPPAPAPAPEAPDDEAEQMAQFFPIAFGRPRHQAAARAELGLPSAAPTSTAPAAATEEDSSAFDFDAFAATRKKKVRPAEEPREKRVHPLKAPTPVYVFGVNNPPQAEPAQSSKFSQIKEEPEEVEYEEVEPGNPYKIPYGHEVALKGHTKAVSALALDPAGARLITGSYDYTVKFWDFPAMDRSLKSFRSIEPMGNYLIHTLAFSNSGDRFLCASQAKHAAVFDRDGKLLVEFQEGYQYLADMAQTKGHVSNLTSAMWHPTDSRQIITASQDSTVRIWDVEDAKKSHKQLIKVKNERNQPKLTVCAITMDKAAKFLVAGCNDGSLQIFPGKAPYVKPAHCVRNAHQAQTDISSVAISKDANTLLSRSCDGSMKVWDIRKFTKPVATFDDLPCHYAEADVVFSPDESLFVTGTSVMKQGTAGTLAFFDKTTLAPVKKLTVSQASVVSLLWHEKINQIMVGSSDGETHVLFEPGLSEKGALYAVQRAPRAKNLDWEPTDLDRPILHPHALPEFKDAPSAKRQREKAAADPVKSHRPEQPQIGHGAKGRIGTSLAADMMKKFIHVDRDVKETARDPREALLAFADEADKNPMFFKVYKENPAPLNYELAQQMQKEEEERQEAQAEKERRGYGFSKG